MIWAIVGVLVVGGAVAPVALGRRPTRSDGARARAHELEQRLSYEVSIAPVDHPHRAAAQERLTTCGGTLARARTLRQLQVAERCAQEGLDLLGQR